jgi:hypothetical protein
VIEVSSWRSAETISVFGALSLVDLKKEIVYESTKRGITGAVQGRVSRLFFVHRVSTDTGVWTVDLLGNAYRE